MATITQEQLKKIISDAPSGTQPKDIVNSLLSRGHNLEGFDSSANQSTVIRSESQPKTSTLSKVGKLLTPIGETLGQTMGIKYAQKIGQEGEQRQTELTQQIIQRIKDPSTTEEQKQKYIQKLNEINPDVVSQIPELQKTLEKTTGQVLGEAGLTGLSMLMGGTLEGVKALSLMGRVAYGTGMGATYGLAGGAAKGETKTDLLKSTAVGGAIGGVLTVAGEALGALRKGLQKVPSKAVAKGTGVTPRDVEKSFYYGSENIADKMMKEGYRGSLEKIRGMAVQNQAEYGNQIGSLLGKYSDKTISRQQIIEKLTDIIDDPFIEAGQKKAAQQVLATIPNKMTPSTANTLKQRFAEKVPEAYWKKPDPRIQFKGEFYKKLSGAIRSTIEEALPENTIKNLNEKWAVARSVRELTSKEASKKFVQGANFFGLGTLLNSVFGKTIGSPWFRTVVTGGKGMQIGIDVVNALSKMSPAEKNFLIRSLTKGFEQPQ